MQGFARAIGLGVAGSLLAASLGCAVLSIGPTTADTSNHQSGKVTIPAGQELDVYYPGPFASPPNLQTETIFDDCLVIEQRPDHFRIKNPSPFSREVRWEARGVAVVYVDAVPGPSATVPATGSVTTGTPSAQKTEFSRLTGN